MKSFITGVTQKGQVTLPKVLRDSAGIAVYDNVKIYIEDGKLIVEPVEDILDIAGTIKPRKNKDLDIMDAINSMESNYFERI